MDVAQLHIRVRGRVQGVGFRWFTAALARAHDVAGWVRNCLDGSVEVRAAGPVAALAALREGLRVGPADAKVTAIDAIGAPAAPIPLPRPFEVWPDAPVANA
jgi:acylphosphatase